METLRIILNANRVRVTLGRVGGGVYKRIDENRELLELLETTAPELLAQCPWVRGWLKSNDEFFCELSAVAPTDIQFHPKNGFPRPWPDETGDADCRRS